MQLTLSMQNNYLLVLFLPICPTDGQDDRREKIFRRSSVKTVKTDVFLFEIDYCKPEMDSGELIHNLDSDLTYSTRAFSNI